MSGDREAFVLSAAYLATRKLIRAQDEDGVQACVDWLCARLGVTAVDADTMDPRALPIDLVVGSGESKVPLVPEGDDVAFIGRYLTAMVSDARRVLDRRAGTELLAQRATTDPLTGLWNRRSLEMAVNRCIHGDCLALLDLDHFKRVNDLHGHDVGDAVLTAFAQHLQSSLRAEDVVGRLGGEEFVVVFPRISVTAATEALTRVRSTWPGVSPLTVTFSAGVCPVPEHGVGDELPGQAALRRADSLMYRAKELGRDLIEAPSMVDQQTPEFP